MPSYSKASAVKLATCDPQLIKLFNEVIKVIDITIIEGHRNQADQHKAFISGHSELDWPKGNHNKLPSYAVDVAPIKYVNGKATIDWNDTKAFTELSVIVKAKAKELGISIIWGGDWKSLKDLPHYELSTK